MNKQASAPSTTELTWRRIRHELEGSPMRMLRFVDRAYGSAALVEAWEDFTLWDEEAECFDPESPHLPVFMPWFLHCWSPDPDETDVVDVQLHGVVPVQAYLQRKGHQLAPILRGYLQSCLENPFSFFEIEHVAAGHSVTLRNLITGQRHEVLERTATHSLHAHDMVYAQLAHVDGITLFEGLCQMVFPPGDKLPVIELRKRVRANAAATDTVQDPAHWDIELRDLYLSMADRLLSPSMPELVTSDGEPLEFHKLVYAIDSAQLAFDALKHLDAIAEDPDHDIQRDADGVLQHAHIDWGKLDQGEDAESGTLLAFIDIDGNQLTAETRSRERAEQLKDIIQAKLDAHATFRVDKIQTFEQMMADAPPPSPKPPAHPDDPEILELKADYLRKHYTAWMDMPLPMLGDHTPRHVAQTADGREQVEALLHEAQNHDIGLAPAVRKSIFDDIRQQLGLAG